MWVLGRPENFLRDACSNASPVRATDCWLENHEFMASSLEQTMRVKRHSTFCLEPPGYGDERKAIVDALTLGCSPVLFVPGAENSFWDSQ